MAKGFDTIFIFIITWLLTPLPCIQCSNIDDDAGNLVFVNILYRHGDRTPVEPYPTDPYRNLSYWPVGWGQLINDGMMGHYKFGKWVRQRYADFLPSEYDRSDIYVQSTDVDRTLMSAYSHLAGLYEPKASKNWDPEIKWRPIPVHTIPEAADLVNPEIAVLAGKKHCPKYDRARKDLYQTDTFQKLLKDNQYLLEALTNATGEKIANLEHAEYIYNTLFIESRFNFSLPAWTEKFYPQPLYKLAAFSFSVDCYTRDMARLKIGPLIKEMVRNMEKKATRKLDPDRKMFMYSGHDETVANLLQGLQVFNQQPPPYFSSVIMELTNKSANYFVSVYYRNSSNEDPHLLTIPGCASLCPLDKFIKLLAPVIPENWEKECQLSLYEMVNDVNGVWIMLYASIASLFIITVSLAIRSYRRKNPQANEFVYQSLSAEAT